MDATMETTSAEAASPYRQTRRLGRGAWALADQMLISAANFVTMVLLARRLDKPTFGTFTLVYASLLFVNILQSTLITRPHNVLGVMLRGSGDYARYTTGTGLSQLLFTLICAVAALVVAAAGHIMQWNSQALLLPMAVCVVGWQLQEFVRRVLYTEGRTGTAFFNDLIAYGGRTAIVGLLFWLHRLSGSTMLLVHGLAALGAVAVGIAPLRSSLLKTLDWSAWRRNWRFGKWLTGAEVLQWFSSIQFYLYLAGGMLGAAATGTLRAASIIFGPLHVVVFFLDTVLPIRFTRALGQGGQAAMHRQLKQAYLLATPVLGGYCLLVALFSGPLLHLMFGPTYDESTATLRLYAVAVLPALMLHIICAALSARQLTPLIFRSYLYTALLTLSVGWLFLLLFAIQGALIAMGLTYVVANVLLWKGYRASRQAVPSAAAGDEPQLRSDPELTRHVLQSLQSQGIPCRVIDGLGDSVGDPVDVDCLIPQEALPHRVVAALQEGNGDLDLVRYNRDHYMVLASNGQAGPLRCVHLHARTEYRRAGRFFYPSVELFGNADGKGRWAPSTPPAIEFGYALMEGVLKDALDDSRAAMLRQLYRREPDSCRQQVRRFFGPAHTEPIIQAVEAGLLQQLDRQRLMKQLRRRAAVRRPLWTLGYRARKALRKLHEWLQPSSGLHLVLLGPDGVGKSTIQDALQRDLAPIFGGTTNRTFAPYLVPRRAGKGGQPHALPPRSLPACLAKAAWWMLYYTLGYYLTTRRDLAAGKLAMNHRYMLDALVDPRRYRYKGPMWLLRLVWRCAVKPDLIILLDAPPQVIQDRKREVAPEETARQVHQYRQLAQQLPNAHVVDAGQPVEKVLADAKHLVLSFLKQRVASNLHVPTSAGGLPPALTWRHLLPTDADYQCGPLAGWLRQSVQTISREGGRQVLISQDHVDLASLADTEALVVPGKKAPSAEALAAAGFGYVRRFAVLPCLRRARWLVPLDSASVSSAAFGLYTPARRSAHFKRFLVRTAVALRVPVWYRDRLTIAQRQPPPLETAVASLFPGRQVRIALSSGAPEPARNRKVSAAIIDQCGEILAFAKLAGSALSRRLIEHEAKVLSCWNETPGQNRPAPRLLFAGEVDGTYVLIQSPLRGRSVGARWSAAHARFLAALSTEARAPALTCSIVMSLRPRLTTHAHALPGAVGLLDRVCEQLDGLELPVTITHGDFAPWNLREEAGAVMAYDWEYATLDGLPLMDQTHYCMQVGALLSRWTPARAARELAVAATQRPMGLSADQVRALQSIYLLDTLLRLLDEGYDGGDSMVRWYQQLLRQVQSTWEPQTAAGVSCA